MDDSQGSDRDFIEYVVKQIVDEPDAVEVHRSVDELGVLITLKVGKFDMGKVIGKSGQTAKSLRTLLRVIGSKNNARVNLKIIEPEGSEMGMGGNMGGNKAMGDDDATAGDDAAASDDSAPVAEFSVEVPAVEETAVEAPVVETPAVEEAAPLEEDMADKHSTLPDDLDLEI
jgi:uncharacterized protein